MTAANNFFLERVPANVIKTIKPITLADEQPPALVPLRQAGFDPPCEGSYFTYTFPGQLSFCWTETGLEDIFQW